MNTLYGLRQNRKSMGTWKDIKKNNDHEALPGFHALTLKEKCLYLIKLSKRNTSHQALVVMGLTLLAVAVDYLFL